MPNTLGTFNLNDSNGLLEEEDVSDLVENDLDHQQLDTVVEPSSTATPTPLLVKPIPKPRPVTTVSKPLPVRPIPKPRPQLIPIANPQADLELPAVNFIVHKKNLKRPCDKEDSEDVKKKKFADLIKDISRARDIKATEAIIEHVDINETCDLVDKLIEDEVLDEDSDEDRQPLQKESPVIEKIDIDMAELVRYTSDNIYEILSLNYHKDSFRTSDSPYYLDVYEEESDKVKKVLQEHESSLEILNNEFVDRLLYLTGETLKQFIAHKKVSAVDVMETSPRRAKIRCDVRRNIVISADKMKSRYAKRKKVLVHTFQIGDSVAIRIPKIDRHKTDTKRIPAMIVKVKASTPPMYKLACKYGTLQGYYSTSELICYPGYVEIANENYEITLRESIRRYSVLDTEVIHCKCKKLCNSNRCPCQKQGLPCHTRCHSGRHCSNKVEDQSICKAFPSYGGIIEQSNVAVCFSNTCPIDNWLTLFALVAQDMTPVFNQIIEASKDNTGFILFLNYIKDKEFLQAKLWLANINKIPPIDNKYDFYGNEEQFTHILKLFHEYKMSSHCSSKYCQVGELTQVINAIPSISTQDSLTPSAFNPIWDGGGKNYPPLAKILNNTKFGQAEGLPELFT